MSSKRLDIQGLRGWAITLVVLFHFFPQHCPHGYLGVDMFFVISGFLMAMILKRVGNLNTVTLGTFYYNRLKRILPLYYLVLTCGLIALFNFCPLSYWATNVASSRKAVALITNIKTKENATESYEKMLQDAQDLFVHTWSLCVEMQWYLLVPIVFFAQRQIVKLEKTFFAVIAAISIVYYLKVDEITSFYSVFARTWQFCCGILAFLCQSAMDPTELFGKPLLTLESECYEKKGAVIL
ncbi:acyltransferase [Ancylostoma ceylanicum]|uniref:Acyltransferase n=1 Tax=Ancylostoma ceylanicum TaxID=53326 RepID=A0A0D6LJ94_9BILA|nr:acyltransferase [Ancylostoma ceylanicum]